ncbi:MAG TPA: glycosyltransferase, partial [Sphingobacteriaceae bacterium]
MKILHVIFSLNVGGSESMLVDVLNEQFKTNEVELIIINRAYDQKLISGINEAIPVHLVNRVPGSLHPGKIFRFNYLLFRIRPDVIHFHDQNAINILAVSTQARTCLTVHDVNQPTENLRKYDRLFSISESVRLDILTRSKYQSDLVYNGIPFSKISRKQQYELHDRLRIVQVGRLFHEKKGQDILLRSLSAIVHRHGVSDISVDFIGEGPSLGHLRDLAARLNVTDHVRFLGGKDRSFIYRHLMDYDLLIQ